MTAALPRLETADSALSAESPPVAYALRYAAASLRVFPVREARNGRCTCGDRDCGSPAKHPLTVNGSHDATTNEATLRGWWTRWPTANIGMTLEGSVVVDVDPRNGGDVDALAHPLPDTCFARTGGGGWHYLYRARDGATYPASLGPGIDVKHGPGAYIVVEPSIHASGETYRWCDETEPWAMQPAEAPAWLERERINGSTHEPAAHTDGIPEGARNAHMTSLAGSMRRRGMTPEAIGAALLVENMKRCTPPLAESEVKAIAASVGRYEPQQPSSSAAPSESVSAAPEFADEALALRFAERHAESLRYVAAWGRWMLSKTTHWHEDDTLLAFDLSRKVCRAAAAECDQDRVATMLASAKTVAAVERLAKTDRRLAATADQWDRDAWLVNTPGGVVDLHTGTMRPHRSDDFLTKLTAVGPSIDPCPLWRSFLKRITGNDDELEAFLRRLVGYCLTGSTREQCLAFLYGTGANGKTVFLETVSGLLADYHKIAPIETFTASSAERHPTDLAGLRGARLVSAVETEEGRRWAESKIKALTGGDRIAARFMRQDFFEFTPQFKLLIAGNHKPGLRCVDEAIRRRFHLVPFVVTIPAPERDKMLIEKLKQEWPAILGWAIDGCLEWQRIGLSAPDAVRDATADYLEAEDALAAWADERCERNAQAWESSTDLFASWKAWADRAGEHSGTRKRFAQNLESRGIAPNRKNQARGFVGLLLKREPEPWWQK